MLVRIEYHREEPGWWAESPDAAGFSAAGETFAEVRQLAQEGLAFHFERDDLKFDETGAPGVTAWEVFPPVGEAAEYIEAVGDHTALTAG